MITSKQRNTLCKHMNKQYRIDGFLHYIDKYIKNEDPTLKRYVAQTISFYAGNIQLKTSEIERNVMADTYIRSRKLPPSKT